MQPDVLAVETHPANPQAPVTSFSVPALFMHQKKDAMHPAPADTAHHHHEGHGGH